MRKIVILTPFIQIEELGVDCILCEGVDDHRNGISNGGTAPTSACVGCHCCYKTSGRKIDSDDLPGDGDEIDYGCEFEGFCKRSWFIG